MGIHVEGGKGDKDRWTMLSPQLADGLRNYWRIVSSKEFLFPGDLHGPPTSTFAVQYACKKARLRSGLEKPITPHSIRRAFAIHSSDAATIVTQLKRHLKNFIDAYKFGRRRRTSKVSPHTNFSQKQGQKNQKDSAQI
jgi:integrase